MHISRWRHYRNYVFLLPLFAIALFYQITYSVVAIQVLMHGTTTPSRPFGTDGQIVTGVDRGVQDAGLHPGDRILAINAVPFTGDRVLMEQIHHVAPNQKLTLTIIPKGQTATQVVQIPPRFQDDSPPGILRWITVLLLLSMMFFCVVVGVYVAAVLPNDIRALTVFGLMTSTAQLIAFASWYHFPRSLWVFADAMHSFGVGTWVIWLIIFSLYFPHRFRWDTTRPQLKWLPLLPLIIWSAIEIAGSINAYSSFGEMAYVSHVLQLQVVNSGGLFAAAVAFFFISTLAKISENRDPDSSRRLRILLAGSVASLTPVVAVVVYQAARFNKVPKPLSSASVSSSASFRQLSPT